MNTFTAYLTALAHTLRARIRAARATPERGDIADQIVWISLLVLLAIAVVGIITAKVTSRANGLDL